MAQRGNMLVAGHICRHTTWAVAPVSSLYNSSIHQQQLVLTATVVGSTARMIKLDYILRQVMTLKCPLVDEAIMPKGHARLERLHGIGS